MGKSKKEMQLVHQKKARQRKAKTKRLIEEGKKKKRERPKGGEKAAKPSAKKAEGHEPKTEAAASDSAHGAS